ncbi:hypothetical protein AX805_12935 [Listeria monocytogenes]|nr:hypothetical protein [Listeria monocytogenes]EAF9053793.1 hypothetical protein [Listeria monocytogenes]EAF9077979.1 hypothetical protein [Listeria monocytogenes]
MLSIYAISPCPAFTSETSTIPETESNTAISPSLLSDSVTLLGNPDNDTDIQPRSIIGGIAIFVGGILAGYIVDGVIIYATGQPSAEWIARGMRAAQNYLSKNPKHKSTVHVTKDGTIMGGGGRGF